LPEGYKLNPDAPQLLQVRANGIGTSYTFPATEPPYFKVKVAKDEDLNLNLTLYYCQTGDERLCLIHDTRLILPLILEEGAATSVQAEYKGWV
jgi:hypothetical protein